MKRLLDEKIIWKKGDNTLFPYESRTHLGNLLIRVNDFPEEPLYTLIINGEAAMSFDNWPEKWQRP